ncbi:hypothetical protein QF028_004949 [Neobacillus sp. B4I6]|uniref:TauD/TfdA family dioxygenase n=1 Tax=Neobacillus sp. B4I6 TaxID=3373925 RepID=UPI003D1C3B33
MIKNLFMERIYTHMYSSNDTNVVQINDLHETRTIKNLIEKYLLCGFAIFEFIDMKVNNETLEAFANSLNLGNAYIPQVYNNYKLLNSKMGFNLIGQKDNDPSHKAFNTSSEQEIHSDGTLEKIGFIKTSLLYCRSQGLSGGENTIFNSTGAFYNLLTTNFDIAKLLLDAQSLKRISSINHQEYIGPAFAIQENKIISRFSLDNTCDWRYGFNILPGLEEAYLSLTDLVYDGSPYYITFKLKPGQGLIMANDKISHGRKEFLNTKEFKREMIRGLFIKNPELTKGGYA